jgi:ligand-binding sensor domain-containing protein
VPGAVLVATSDGVYLNPGAGWTRASDGLSDPSVRVLASDPQDSATVYAGTDWGVFVTQILP